MSNQKFSGHQGDPESILEVNELKCFFNMPKALETKLSEGKEVSQSLPPYAVRKVFKVDEYNCPDNWMHGSGLASSYFVPIEAEHGMWLDFNQNSNHKKHVAILVSVQGVNPLDGQSMVEGALHLRQYRTKCPVHDVEFGADRFCEKCGYKWVPQNYLATTGTPSGLLWLDGFLAADGIVRQYYFTEEEAKGVAHQVIGAEKKVYSIGIAFYLSKTQKPERTYATSLNSFIGGDMGGGIYGSAGGSNNVKPKWMVQPQNSLLKGVVRTRASKRHNIGGQSAGRQHFNSVSGHQISLSDCSPTCSSNVDTGSATTETDFDNEDLECLGSEIRSLDIAAGAKIDQKVYLDPESLDYWEPSPAGLLYINYCPSSRVIEILKKGKKDLTKSGEGFMAGLKVGK